MLNKEMKKICEKYKNKNALFFNKAYFATLWNQINHI